MVFIVKPNKTGFGLGKPIPAGTTKYGMVVKLYGFKQYFELIVIELIFPELLFTATTMPWPPLPKMVAPIGILVGQCDPTGVTSCVQAQQHIVFPFLRPKYLA